MARHNLALALVMGPHGCGCAAVANAAQCGLCSRTWVRWQGGCSAWRWTRVPASASRRCTTTSWRCCGCAHLDPPRHFVLRRQLEPWTWWQSLPPQHQQQHEDCLVLLAHGLHPSACVRAPQAERLDTLPTGRQLSYGAYHDQARPLRRVLKQVGAGSLEAGLAAVRADEAALREVAAVISLDPKARPGAAAW